ncbi:hypothetical protein [Streptomyces mutabilis]|uniref:Uncharacterized protein n=1 Tax=Streptomyces mutabilis TaxID=67332 RepID=A0A086MR05_9ACTN|nr:hypothetical protein [Streptomyces mutabilis]KFG71323.1 hypothetical protein FM21_33975 [Streptomyces mutabilis]
MGRCVIKAARDEDLYLEWSSIVDACTRVGTRADFLASGHRPEALDRADRNGTSDCVAQLGGWDDESLGVGTTEHRQHEGPLILNRADLAAFARHLAAGHSQQAENLLIPDPEPLGETA